MRTRLHGLLLACAAMLAACNDDEEAPFSPPSQIGRLRFVNATPDTTAAKTVNVRIDGVPLAANLAYMGATGYALASAGSRTMSVRKTADTSVVVFDVGVTVAGGTDYSVLATGLSPDLAALILTDNSGLMYLLGTIRVVNASPAMGAVDVYITAPGADLTAETPVVTSLAYRTATGNLGLLSDTAQIRFTTAGTTTEVLTGPKLKLTSSQIRTVVALDAAGGGPPYTFVTLTDR